MPRREPWRDEATVLDILHAARHAIAFVDGLDEGAFRADPKSQSAALHQLLIIGEAVKRLSSEFCQAHPEVAWTLIAGMRDRLIHGYDSVDLGQVWRTLAEDVPNLVAQLESQEGSTD